MILRKFCFIFALIFSISLSFSSSVFAAPSYTYTGSSTLVNDGNGLYRIKFLTSGTFTPTSNMTIDAFLVGGGGASSYSLGGGGGGGYTNTINHINLVAGNPYNIIVGNGGIGTNVSGTGAQGFPSSAFGYSVEGGFGGTFMGKGGNGGSGGGGTYNNQYSINYCDGGVDGSNGGEGGGNSGGTGQGTTTSEFNDGINFYAGGGASYGGYVANGGGAYGSNGTANTGGGAGSAAYNTTGKNGGSGIVIIRYLEASEFPNADKYLYTGSSTLVNDGNGLYRIKFLTSGTFTPTSNMTIDAFLVGGGGASSYSLGGGGGGGYTNTINHINLVAGNTYDIAVGGGGIGNDVPGTGPQGRSSSAFDYSVEGGFGGTYSAAGGNGGSGGGGQYYSGGSPNYCDGGIDGSNGGAGGNTSTRAGGTGQGTTTTEFNDGINLYAGGGSGGAGGVAGAGGGGAENTNGTANTGGGAGSAAYNTTGKNGGSGIVIIRYLEASEFPNADKYLYTGSSTLVNDGNGLYRIKFLTSGTFTPKDDMLINAFLVGGGGASSYSLGGGGGGGYTNTINQVNLIAGNTYDINVGGGGIGNNVPGTGPQGRSSSAFGYSVAGGFGGTYLGKGGNGGSGGGGTYYSGGSPNNCSGGTDGSNGGDGGNATTYAGGTGQGTTTKEFGEATGNLYAGGGSGGGNGIAGSGGGGASNTNGTANTGGGAGSAAYNVTGKSGGLGIIIIRITDTTAPSGGSISYSATNITSATQTFSITVADGTDSESGINISSRQLLRQEAVLTNGTCGSYGAASSVSYSGTYPNITTTNFEPNRCYKYQWSVSDNAGNNVIYSSSTVITSSASVIGIKDVALGSFVSIDGFNFIKVNPTGLLVAAVEYAIDFTQTFSYTGTAQTFTAPYNGWYQIEAWGASGGSHAADTAVGGNGGYSRGSIYLNKNDILYIYIGQNPTYTNTSCYTTNANTSFNGVTTGSCSSGGGATDIRLTSGNWNDITSLRSRILIAGGGGGAVYNGSAGVGGSLIGGTSNDGTTGGTQLATYFGTGSVVGGTTSGGGGYYGGQSIYAKNAGGGSSFISGYAGVNAITSAASTTATNTTLHYSGKYFIDGEMQAGVNSGDGKAKITYLSETKSEVKNTNLNNVRYIKDCENGSSAPSTWNEWVELQAIYNGTNVAKGKTVTGTIPEYSGYPYTRIVDGDITSSNYATGNNGGLQCITVDLGQTYDLDEIAVWHYWADGRTCYSNTTYVSADNSTWTAVIANADAETVNGKRVNAYNTNTIVASIYRVTNLLLDPTFSSGNTNWSIQYSNATSSFASGTATITATAQYGGLTQDLSSTVVNSIKGHQVYGSAMLMANSLSVYWVSINDGFLQQTPTLTQINTWQRLSAIQIFNASSTSGYVKTQDSRTSSWVAHYMKEPMLIDLTATFGVGKEPAKAWCDANINYFAGTQNLYLSP